MLNSIRFKARFMTFIMLATMMLFSNLTQADDLKLLHDETFSTSPEMTLNLESDAGDVKISTWSESKVSIKVHANKNAAERLDFEFGPDQNGIMVKAEKKSRYKSLRKVNLKFDIQLPKSYHVTLSTGGGDLDIKDLKGNLDISTSGGDIYLKWIEGAVEASTAGGDIDLKSCQGQIDIRTSGGDIDGDDFSGELTAKTSGGSIDLEGSDAPIDASTSGGDVSLAYSGRNFGIELKTSGGDITLELPSDFQADLDLNTSAGDIVCEFAVTATRSKKFVSDELEGDINGGGELIDCETSAGDIEIRKLGY